MTSERTADAKSRAVARGVPPFPNVPPGYRQRDDGTLEPHPKEKTVVAEVFRMRANGATVNEVRDFLRENGIERTFHGVQSLLGSRIVLGELRFGETVNPRSHTAIVERPVWSAVQRMRVPRGRRAKSERLLARLGVLRCGTCGGRMVIGSSDQNGKRHYMYRCSPIGDCPRRMTVSADLVEGVVVNAVREALAGMQGTATIADGASDAEHVLERAEHDLDAAVRAFTGLDDVDAARDRLLELREARDLARDRMAELQAAVVPAVTVSAGDWDSLSLDGRRALVRAVVDRVVIAPGRGPDRITVELRGQ